MVIFLSVWDIGKWEGSGVYVHGAGDGRIYVYCTIMTALGCSTGGTMVIFQQGLGVQRPQHRTGVELMPGGRMEGIVEHEPVLVFVIARLVLIC